MSYLLYELSFSCTFLKLNLFFEEKVKFARIRLFLNTDTTDLIFYNLRLLSIKNDSVREFTILTN